MWLDAITNTIILIFATSIISICIGSFTAIIAWWSNKSWAIYIPLLTLAIPPWVFGYYLSEMFVYINPWVGATISLGVCSSVYPHSIISSSLSNRAHKNWEMLVVIKGKSIESLIKTIMPSLKISILPSLALISAECVADFGVSNFYGINTITMTTFNVWASTWNLELLWYGIGILVIFGLLISLLDMNMKSSDINGDMQNDSSNFYGVIAILPTLILIAFIISVSVYWMFNYPQLVDNLVNELMNSILLVVVVVLVCVFVASLYITNTMKFIFEKSGLFFYSIPGTVIGAFLLYYFGAYISLFVLLVIGIVIRYYGLVVHSLAASNRGNISLFEVVDVCISDWRKKLIAKMNIILPSVIIGLNLIILDVLRELPISLILQPMNFQTLAMRMNYVSLTENISGIAVHSMILIFMGILSSFLIIWVLYVKNRKNRKQFSFVESR